MLWESKLTVVFKYHNPVMESLLRADRVETLIPGAVCSHSELALPSVSVTELDLVILSILSFDLFSFLLTLYFF